MGIRTSNTCDVVFEDCRIPASNLIGAEGKGFSIAMKTLDQARTWMGCVATGIAQRPWRRPSPTARSASSSASPC